MENASGVLTGSPKPGVSRTSLMGGWGYVANFFSESVGRGEIVSALGAKTAFPGVTVSRMHGGGFGRSNWQPETRGFTHIFDGGLGVRSKFFFGERGAGRDCQRARGQDRVSRSNGEPNAWRWLRAF